MNRTETAASEIARHCGTKLGKRILHVSDFHNRLKGVRLTSALVKILEPDVVVNTGDICGIGSRIEAMLVSRLFRWGPQVFAPGNHDSSSTMAGFESAGAAVLDEPRLVEIGGIPIWGYRDPNETPMFGPRYDVSLCKTAAIANRPPIGLPLVVAVHHLSMVQPHPDVTLVLTGHVHSQKTGMHGGALWVRCGSTGGGGPFGGALQAAVIDVDPTTLHPKGLWLINVGEEVSVRVVGVGEKPASERTP